MRKAFTSHFDVFHMIWKSTFSVGPGWSLPVTKYFQRLSKGICVASSVEAEHLVSVSWPQWASPLCRQLFSSSCLVERIEMHVAVASQNVNNFLKVFSSIFSCPDRVRGQLKSDNFSCLGTRPLSVCFLFRTSGKNLTVKQARLLGTTNNQTFNQSDEETCPDRQIYKKTFPR